MYIKNGTIVLLSNQSTDVEVFENFMELSEYAAKGLSVNQLLHLRDFVLVDCMNALRVKNYLGKSVSHATLRTQDLIAAFLPVLRDLDWQKKNKLCIAEGQQWLQRYADYDGNFDESDATNYLNEDLFVAIDIFAPEGYYFGANEGDGSDFGFWAVDHENGDLS